MQSFITEKNGFIVKMSIFACVVRKPTDRCREDLFEIKEYLQR